MEQVSEFEVRLQQWSVPSDVRDALDRIVDEVSRQGVSLVSHVDGDVAMLGVRDQPTAVFLTSSRVSAALAPSEAERAHRADSALGLDKDSDTTWIVHCRYGRLDSSRLNSMAALMTKALRRFAPVPEPRTVTTRAPRKRSPTAAAAAKAPSARGTAARQEERREAATAAIPRCPVPGCNLPMVGGSCGFHD